jgi:hypothetical protein
MAFLTDLTGIYPVGEVVSDKLLKSLKSLKFHQSENMIETCDLCWFIIREVLEKKTKTGKDLLDFENN